MGSDSDFVAAELHEKGITDVTRNEAFQAWLHLAQYDLDHGVVLRTRTLSPGEPVPHPILDDIVTRSSGDSSMGEGSSKQASDKIPSSGPELKAYLDEHILSLIHMSEPTRPY